jgi:hypothetical protein
LRQGAAAGAAQSGAVAVEALAAALLALPAEDRGRLAGLLARPQ